MFAVKPEEWMPAISLAVVASLVVAVILLTGCQPLPAPSAPSSPLVPSPGTKGLLSLTIVHSNDTWGYLTPCG
jgi:hypothetical protein